MINSTKYVFKETKNIKEAVDWLNSIKVAEIVFIDRIAGIIIVKVFESFKDE